MNYDEKMVIVGHINDAYFSMLEAITELDAIFERGDYFTDKEWKRLRSLRGRMETTMRRAEQETIDAREYNKK